MRRRPLAFFGCYSFPNHVLPGYPKVDPAISVTILGYVQRGGTPTGFDRCRAHSWASRYELALEVGGG